jgi:hypothetical protein
MARKHSRIAAVVTALLAGGLAAYALRPAPGTATATLAARNPAVEVRTQVIRRTIHVIRHEPGARLPGPRGSSVVAVGAHRHGHVATAASGSHHSTSGARSAAVATRVSGSHSPSSTGSAGSGAPVSTRASGSHSASSSGSAGRPVTRSSGSSHHGDGGGDGHDGSDDN